MFGFKHEDLGEELGGVGGLLDELGATPPSKSERERAAKEEENYAKIRTTFTMPGFNVPFFTARSRLWWTSVGVPQSAEDYGSVSRPGGPRLATCACMPQFAAFRGAYLIVTTPGWQIVEATCGKTPFLHDVDGDAYSRAEHDRLEREGQLERHRIQFIHQIGCVIQFRVASHYPKLKTDRRFTAVIIGVALDNNY